MKTVGILAALMLLLNGAVAAQQDTRPQNPPPPPPSLERLMQDLDKNKDGLISKKEVRGPLVKDFDRVDSNKDGFLSKAELEKAPKPPKRPHPRRGEAPSTPAE